MSNKVFFQQVVINLAAVFLTFWFFGSTWGGISILAIYFWSYFTAMEFVNEED